MTPDNLILLVATTNQGKLREVRQVLSGLNVIIESLADHHEVPIAEETGKTFLENASLKAAYYAQITGRLTLADDSGLEVDALDGAPGVYSARFAGPQADDHANNDRLIAMLQGVPQPRRTARFRCAIALSNSQGVLATTEGHIEGIIIEEPRGKNGFGYDPHFFVPEFGMTTAEMTPAAKNEVSHRGRALRAMRPHLERILQVVP